MNRSTSQTAAARPRYYNPISKIRSLIHSLDAELMQLCNQCSISKYNSPYYRNLPNSVSLPNPPTVTNRTAHEKIHTRTLSSIYRARVIEAYRHRRIFTVFGNYHTVRRGLLRRGWLEKLPPGRYPRLQNLSEELLLLHAKRGNDYEAVAISKIINHFPAFFVWQSKAQRDIYGEVFPMRNRVRRGRAVDFSTKIGLIGCAEIEKWYREDGISGMSYPRFYRLNSGSTEDRIAFIEDFRLTQCRCLIRYILDNVSRPDLIDPDIGSVDLSIVNFAVASVTKQVEALETDTLDDNGFVSSPDPENAEWKQFIYFSSQIINRKGKFKSCLWELLAATRPGRIMLERLNTLRPEMAWDGNRNLWILKPGFQCRGIGIIIRNSIDEILQWAAHNPNKRYIAQKYVERPLLIFRAKFDIRQYMMMTIGEAVVRIWMFKDCYLRFSSQDFTVDDLRESIHLTNNSVQKKYKNKLNRDPRLPKCNMWSLNQFKEYLKVAREKTNIWEDLIYPGLKQNLIAVVLASLDDTDFVQNAFELYGCDFMLDEDFTPILIEINSTPDLTPSTEVTANICPTVLRDLVKVIVDYPKNSRVETGDFELIYEVNYKYTRTEKNRDSLNVIGKTMPIHQTPRTPFRSKLFKKQFQRITKKMESKMPAAPKKGKKKHVARKQMTPEEPKAGPSGQPAAVVAEAAATSASATAAASAAAPANSPLAAALAAANSSVPPPQMKGPVFTRATAASAAMKASAATKGLAASASTKSSVATKASATIKSLTAQATAKGAASAPPPPFKLSIIPRPLQSTARELLALRYTAPR